jgi:hypothetical protein
MSKSSDDACRHACQCNGCKLWYCANDQIHYCTECSESLMCYSCLNAWPSNWNIICKQCWIVEYKRGELVSKSCIKCKKCDRHRRISSKKYDICFSCYKQRRLRKKKKMYDLHIERIADYE